jgi:hypothetical protein
MFQTVGANDAFLNAVTVASGCAGYCAVRRWVKTIRMLGTPDAAVCLVTYPSLPIVRRFPEARKLAGRSGGPAAGPAGERQRAQPGWRSYGEPSHVVGPGSSLAGRTIFLTTGAHVDLCAIVVTNSAVGKWLPHSVAAVCLRSGARVRGSHWATVSRSLWPSHRGARRLPLTESQHGSLALE